MKKILSSIFLFLIFSVGIANSATDVLVVNIDKVITKAHVELIKEAIEEKPDIIVLTLDTTGGELTATLEIMRLIENSEIPFVGYVYPKGSKAWSAGTFILLSTHVAAMAPYTVIGSSQPVSLGLESSQPINESKIINALTAFIEERMRMHNRNITISKKFITENLNLNDVQALNAGVIEILAEDISDLMNKIDGMKLKTKTGEITLKTRNVKVEKFQPSMKVGFLSIVADPVIASILLMIGIYALIFGFSSPGFGSEIFGIFMILLGLIGIGFDINFIGLLLIFLGGILILFEFTTPGFGIVGITGIIAVVLGIILIGPLTSPNWSLSREFKESLFFAISLPAVILALFLLFALFKVAEIKFKKPVIGELSGETAKAEEDMSDKEGGFVLYNGELWKAKVEKGKRKIKKGEEVRIVRKEGTLLIVEPLE
ncbi:MAG: nodulation protein NfeD [Candidatus Altiarchaeota archaeon]